MNKSQPESPHPKERSASAPAERSAPGPDGNGEVTESDLFEVLANGRRRYTLHALSENDERRDIGSLADQVAAWENDTTVENVDRKQRKSVYTALQQLHLPKLDEAGLVNYDKDRGVVTPTAAKEDADIYLDVVRGNDIPWHEYYLALSAVSAGLITVSWLGVYPFSLLPAIGWAFLVVLAFTVSSLVHYRLRTEMQIGTGDEPPAIKR